MKRGYKKLLLLNIVLILLLIVNIRFNILSIYTYILFLTLVFLGTIYLIGFEKDDFLFKKDIITITIISCLFYSILTYASGLFIGFLKSSYKLTFSSIANNILPVIVIIILEELIRYNLVKKSSRNKYMLIITTIVLILMDINLIIKSFDLANPATLVKFIFAYLLVSIAKNICLTYLTYKGGYKPNIAYRSIMELPLYFMPIFANLGIYVESVSKILFPAILILIVYKLTMSRENRQDIRNYKFKKVIPILVGFLIIIMIGINSGLFKYYSLTIGSGSMRPDINVGDVIIIQKMSKEEKKSLAIGDVLIFKHGNIIVAHRIVDIKTIDNTLMFYTKGDYNKSVDTYVTSEDEVIGKSVIKIKYVGLPTVWLNERMKK